MKATYYTLRRYCTLHIAHCTLHIAHYYISSHLIAYGNHLFFLPFFAVLLSGFDFWSEGLVSEGFTVLYWVWGFGCVRLCYVMLYYIGEILE